MMAVLDIVQVSERSARGCQNPIDSGEKSGAGGRLPCRVQRVISMGIFLTPLAITLKIKAIDRPHFRGLYSY